MITQLILLPAKRYAAHPVDHLTAYNIFSINKDFPIFLTFSCHTYDIVNIFFVRM